MSEAGKNVMMSDVSAICLNQNLSINKNVEYQDLFEKKERKKLQRKSLQNLIVFSLCYFLTYTGFWALSNLQSTMNAAGGLGDYSQAVIYIFSMISSLFLPTVLIDKFGCKNILVFGTVICCFSIGSNMYLRWDLMMTAAVAFGMVNGPFISSQTFYIDEMATRFQSTLNENLEFIMAAFFGVLMFFSESTQIWGNVIAYYVLRNGEAPARNVSTSFVCGEKFSPSDTDLNENLDPPTDHQRLLLVGIYLAMSFLSVVILVIFLDPLKNDVKAENSWRTVLERFIAAFKQLRNPQQFLMVPLSIYIGMEGPFYSNEVTQMDLKSIYELHATSLSICINCLCNPGSSKVAAPETKSSIYTSVSVLAKLTEFFRFIKASCFKQRMAKNGADFLGLDDTRHNPCINENNEHLSVVEQFEARKLRRKSLWNMFIFSACYFLTFTGFWTLSNLQSTMNAAGGIEDYSQVVIYVLPMVSSPFLPKIFIEKFGCKSILVVGTLACCLTIASNMYQVGLHDDSISLGRFGKWTLYFCTDFIHRRNGNPFSVNRQREYRIHHGCLFGTFLFLENTQVWGNMIFLFRHEQRKLFCRQRFHNFCMWNQFLSFKQ
ncbi:UNC93-like protein like [Argiope bruennichi]|uniref:UNC93-like protein like n=1 Tax=Argiope bruennichi TaxID=94029 RepID=A0A8T0FST1_ARGBR|nr:UNC93-like protein like [Argiope bruennichi]